MEYKLYVDYKNIEWLRNGFFDFSQGVFGISFKEWYEYGFWNDKYICYSLVDNRKMISNISISKIKVFIDGSLKNAIQLATVGTLKDYRGKGLSRCLMERVLAEYEDRCDLFFLSANNSVIDFYPKFGFRRIIEYKYTARKPVIRNKGTARKMNLKDKDDLTIILNRSQGNIPLSNIFDISDYTHILMWYLVNFYKECIWYIEDKGIVVICKVLDRTLHVFDILSKDNFQFFDILVYLTTEEFELIRFHFTPDKMGIEVNSEPIMDDDPFFVQGSFSLKGKEFKVPQLAQT